MSGTEPEQRNDEPPPRGSLLVWLPLILLGAVFAGLGTALVQKQLAGESTPAIELLDQPVPAFQTEAAPDDQPGANLTAFDQHDALTAGAQGLYVINFFASWCAPCRMEHPWLLRLAREQHLPVIGIAYRDSATATDHYLQEAGNPYRLVGLDRNGAVGLGFGITGVPESFIIDGRNHIRYRIHGPLTEIEYDKLMLALAQLDPKATP